MSSSCLIVLLHEQHIILRQFVRVCIASSCFHFVLTFIITFGAVFKLDDPTEIKVPKMRHAEARILVVSQRRSIGIRSYHSQFRMGVSSSLRFIVSITSCQHSWKKNFFLGIYSFVWTLIFACLISFLA